MSRPREERKTAVQTLVSQVRPLLKSKRSVVPVSSPIQVWPHDPWTTKPDTGQWLLSGLVQYPAGFEAAVEAFWSVENCVTRHNFSWLCDLKAIGGDQARQSARILVASWLDKYRSSKRKSQNGSAFSESAVVARRVLALLQSYDFHGASASENYQSLVSYLIMRDGSYLYKKISGGLVNISGTKDYFYESCSLITAALCLEDHVEWVDTGEQNLLLALDVQVLQDGGHISRSPQRLVDVLKHCLDLRRLYQDVNQPFPEGVQLAIDRMAQALKFFRYIDKGLAVFHGTQEGDEKNLDLILHQTGQNKKIVKSLPNSGYERLTQGRSIVMVDVGNAPSAPFDRQAHLAPLSFEFSHGKDRVVVNCGTHAQNAEWADALRRTSAHSTLSLDYRDVMDIKLDGGIKNRPTEIISERSDEKGAILLEAMHDGYMPHAGLKHVRRVYLSEKGQDIRGEDSLFFDGGVLGAPHQASIRFHLHPKVRVSLVRNGESALLRLFSGVGWRFQQSGARMELEDSVYMGYESKSATPVKTKQLVLYFDVESEATKVKWAFQRDM